MSAAQAIREQFERAHAGDPWYGTRRARFIEGVSAAEAASTPIAESPSMWALVLHMTAWTREVTRRLRGAEPHEPPEGDWPPVGAPTEERWAAACEALAAAHAEAAAAFAALEPGEVDAPVGTTREPALGTGVTRAGMMVGLAQHDAYHTGQLALLRRAIDRRRAG